ncbi:MAG: hypothetical protein ABSF24_06680 [Candidatus Bathyarchaeia archaeon]
MPVIVRRVQVTREEIASGVIGAQRRISEGIINQRWPSTEREIPAGTLGLTSVTNMILTGGTPLSIIAHARVVNPGSSNNTVRIQTYMQQAGFIRIGTPRYTTFNAPYSATPIVMLTTGSPVARTIGTYEPRLKCAPRPGSFATVGSPTFANNPYIAIGQGSYPLNFMAMGY